MLAMTESMDACLLNNTEAANFGSLDVYFVQTTCFTNEPVPSARASKDQ